MKSRTYMMMMMMMMERTIKDNEKKFVGVSGILLWH